MNIYTQELITELSAHGLNAEVAGTGGGCEEITVAGSFGITNGDAGLPDGDVFDGVVAFVAQHDDEGDMVSDLVIRAEDAPTVEDVARIAADWINARA